MRSQALEGLTVTVLGGDDRELVLIPALAAQGARVRAVGFPRLPQLEVAELVSNLPQAVQGADVVVLPMPGTDDEGIIRAVYSPTKLILTEEVIQSIPRRAVIFIGSARPFLREWVARYGLKLVEIAEEDEVAVLNSIPTAEGAIQLAMQELPITIHGARAFVLGFGRVGQTLARCLLGLGAEVTAVDRKPAARARAFEMGCRPLPFASLAAEIGRAEVIFNTVPAMVLDATVLAKVSPHSVIIDLASAPGGTDFQAAAALGIKAILAPGLPGKVAPRTAGQILARVMPRLIRQHLGLDPLP